MEQGENIFFIKEEDETGFSEAELDKTIELHAGQWLDLPKMRNSSKPLISKIQPTASNKSSSKKMEKILYQLRVINHDIQEKLSKFMNLENFYSDEAEKKLQIILDLQSIQKTLLKSLIWLDKGEFDESKLPKQLQNLLK